MDDVRAEASYLQLILHNDDETPLEFVVQLLHSGFNKPVAEATTFAESIDTLGKAVCGVYPRDVAEALLDAARMRIRRAGHSLVITSAAAAESGLCKLCDGLCGDGRPSLSIAALICDSCTYEITRTLPGLTRGKQFSHACEALAWHFAGIPRDQLVATSRQFPGHMRADVQVALDKLFSTAPIRFFGIHEQYRYETLELMRRIAQASIARDGGRTVESADIGEALDDMLFAGGKLNIKLLGGAQGVLDG